ncbi:MAG: DUF262 domain-containing protein [Gammaproteobacteria bacterium]|nr:DUF262 domain-containing protein [Gammaproteobacteria bacterium]
MFDSENPSPEQLLEATDLKRKRAETKSLDVSLNELADMYEANELKIRPEFQRLFRWSESKQSQFIESLLLEMPIPAVFIIEIEEGKWELIDGLQRLSTFLHYRGQLEAPDLDPPIRKGDKLALTGCDILEELNGTSYDDLPLALQIRLKRSFLRVEAIRQDTDPHFRYYMFKRLNTGGELLSEQEVRNCTIRLLDEKFNAFLIELSRNDDFKTCISSLTEDRRRMMGDVELVLRFFAFKNNFSEFRYDVRAFLTDYMERVSDNSNENHIKFNYPKERLEFGKIFKVLAVTLGENTCIRCLEDDRYGGQFLIHHFEALSLGVAKVADRINDSDFPWADIKDKLADVKKDPEFRELITGGGQNSPGPYKKKIDFVSEKLRSLL